MGQADKGNLRKSKGMSVPRILLATIGSLGDLHPCLALGIELRRRGHSVVIASTPWYRERVEAQGFDFRPLRPAWNPTDPELIRQCEDLRRGPEILIRQLVLPHLRDTFADLVSAATEPGLEADLMIAGELVYAAPLVAEKLGLPWASAILSPSSFLSAHDLSVLVNVPPLLQWRWAPWRMNRALMDVGRAGISRWWRPLRAFRRELGLGPGRDPLFYDKFSPDLVLALFSSALAKPQPDWPVKTLLPGFVFYSGKNGSQQVPPELGAFLAETDDPKDAPIVFTLGSTAVHNPGNFYAASAEAAERVGRRAVLLGAKDAISGSVTTSTSGSSKLLSVPYAPYSALFPRAAAIVHQGGSGTTGEALRAGRPMLFVPYGWDQPDNAARVQRLGSALTIARTRYTVETATAALARLLDEPSFTRRACEIATHVAAEDALTGACNAIDRLLNVKATTLTQYLISGPRIDNFDVERDHATSWGRGPELSSFDE
jgi:rhamnosyltransferase subunit B